MADDVFIKWDQKTLDELLESPDGAVGRYAVKICVKVVNHAKKLCAVDTGRLRSSITYEIGESGGELAARVGTNVEYAPYVEFGTRRMRAQPFLRPAIDSVRNVP